MIEDALSSEADSEDVLSEAERAQIKRNREFSVWCVMTHARPALVGALRAWGLREAAKAIEESPSLSALKLTAFDAYTMVRKAIIFGPLRRDLFHAINTLHAAATFAGRGDIENTAAVVIGVFTGAAGAITWRRPWRRLKWRQQRAAVITAAVQEQAAHRKATQG